MRFLRQRKVETMLRIGVVGYGTGGRHFHTPFIAAANNCTLAGIVARAPKTVATAKADWPDTPIYASLNDMIAAGTCDAVTITTPPQTRRELVLEAIHAGLHVSLLTSPLHRMQRAHANWTKPQSRKASRSACFRTAA